MSYGVLGILIGSVLASTATAQRFGELPGNVLDTYPLTGTKVPSLGDVDRDGDLDMVVDRGGSVGVDQSIVELWLGDGTGGFTQAKAADWKVQVDRFTGWPTNLVADFNGDGTLDVLLVGTAAGPGWRLLLGNGRGSFVEAWTKTFAVGTSVIATTADIEGDGDVDVVPQAHWYSGSVVLRNDGKGNFTLVGLPRLNKTFDRQLVAIDIDGDRDMDFLQGWPFRLLVQNPAWVFKDETAARFGTLPDSHRDFIAGDVDGDGDQDAIAIRNNDTTLIYRNAGKGTFVADKPDTFNRKGTFLRFHFDDFDGDRDLDAFVHEITLGQVEYWRNDGAAGFVNASSRMFRVPTMAWMTSAYVDCDDDKDLLFRGGHFLFRGPIGLFTNFERQLYASQGTVGGELVLTAYAQPGFADRRRLLLPAIGARLPVLVRIPGIGLLGLNPAIFLTLPPITTAAVHGTGNLRIPVPNYPGLRGLEFWLQGTWLDGRGEVRLSNLRRTKLQ